MDANESDLVLVRDILVREIETINFYHRLLDQAQGDDAKNFLRHIIEEEKEHVAEALMLIKQYDPTQATLLQSGNHWRESAKSPVADDGSSEAGTNFQTELLSSSLTVGSLRKG